MHEFYCKNQLHAILETFWPLNAKFLIANASDDRILGYTPSSLKDD